MGIALVKEDPFQRGVLTVKNYFPAAALAALLLVASASAARAQHPASANAERYKIGVVDISYIFKEHAQFKQQIESMKTRMEALDKQFAEERKAITAKEEQRNQYKPNTQEFKNLDIEITRAKADFAVQAEQEQKRLMEEEANMYYQTYLEVQDAITVYAKRHDLALVLRFNGDDVDPGIRQDIIRGINRPVVYQNSIDITPDILTMVNRSAAPPAQSSAVGSRNATVPPRK
jgi:Skp family chaperone for outer membrane proteins